MILGILACASSIAWFIFFILWRRALDGEQFWHNTCLWERDFISTAIREGKDIKIDGAIYKEDSRCVCTDDMIAIAYKKANNTGDNQ